MYLSAEFSGSYAVFIKSLPAVVTKDLWRRERIALAQ